MKLIITRASILTLFAVVLSFLSTSASADCFTDGFNAGQATCPTCPNCQEDYNRGKQDGINQCKANPETYGLVRNCNCAPDRYQEGFNTGQTQGVQQGINQCKTNPGSYGLVRNCNCAPDRYQEGVNAGKTQGIQEGITQGKKQCQDNPNTVGCEGLLKSDATAPNNVQVTQAGIDEGKRQCQDDPNTVGCEGLLKSDATAPNNVPVTQAGIDEGKRQCQDDPNTVGCEGLLKFDATALNGVQVTQAGIDEGKRQCQKNPATEGCYTNLATGEIPNEDCDNKTKNCFSHGQLYLPTVELANDSFLKDIKMDALIGENDKEKPEDDVAIFVYKSGVAVEKRELKIELIEENDAKGGVFSFPTGIFCGQDCVEYYEKDSDVTLVAAPLDSESIFTEWTGCDERTNRIITVQMNDAKTCTAKFGKEAPTKPALTVSISGDGQGVVTSEPNGINCNNTTCPTAQFEESTVVVLTAKPDNGFSFIQWSGDCVNIFTTTEEPRKVATIAVTMNDVKTCDAQFDKNYELKVTTSGTGQGTVTSSPTGTDIDCAKGQCQQYSRDIQYVLLTAKSDDDKSSFVKWKGTCTNNALIANTSLPVFIVEMDKDKTCDAEFDLESE